MWFFNSWLPCIFLSFGSSIIIFFSSAPFLLHNLVFTVVRNYLWLAFQHIGYLVYIFKICFNTIWCIHQTLKPTACFFRKHKARNYWFCFTSREMHVTKVRGISLVQDQEMKNKTDAPNYNPTVEFSAYWSSYKRMLNFYSLKICTSLLALNKIGLSNIIAGWSCKKCPTGQMIWANLID